MINAGNSTAVVKEQIEDAVALAGYSAPTSWTDATDKINGTADQFERDQIADGMNGGLARDRINALFGGPVWAPEGAQLTIDFAANKAWTRNNAVTDSVDAVDLTRAGSVLMEGPDGYQAFPANTLARIDGIGAQVAPARVNKCTNYNAAPTDLTGVIKGGDAAAILSLVDDRAALEAAGLFDELLAEGKMNGSVYRLDNSAGSGVAQAQILGAVGNLNAHSISVYVRGGSGNIQIAGGLGVLFFSASDNYRRLKSENIVPSATGNVMYVVANAGSIVYFILNQLEEGSYASPPIITSGAAVSRPGDILSASVPDGGRAFVFEFDLLEPVVASAGNARRILNYQRNPVVANQSMSIALQDNGVIGLAVFRGGFIATVQFAAPVLGRNVCYGVFADNYIRGGVNSTDGSANTTLGNITSDLGLCAFLNNGSTTTGNTFGYPRRYAERPVTDFATPADAFAWAKSVAQGWAS